MTQKTLLNYTVAIDNALWIIEQLRSIGMTYKEMANRMGVNESTLYRYRKGIHRTPQMTKKILDLFDNPYFGVAIFKYESGGTPYLWGEVYPAVYNEKDLERLVNFDNEERTLLYSKFVKRFTTAMVLKHQKIAFELMRAHKLNFTNLDGWLIEQVNLMKTQKTRNKALKLLKINYKEAT